MVLASGANRGAEAIGLDTGQREPVQLPGFAAVTVAVPERGLIVLEPLEAVGLELHAVNGSGPLVRHVPLPPEAAADWSESGVLLTDIDTTGSRLIAGTALGADPWPAHVWDLQDPEATWRPFTRADGTQPQITVRQGEQILTIADEWVVTDWEGTPVDAPLDLPVKDLVPAPTFIGATATRLLLSFGDLAGEGREVIYDTSSGPARLIRRIPWPSGPDRTGIPSFSTDGALFSRADGNGGTELFDATTGDRLEFPHPFEAIQFGPPGTWFLTVDENHTIHKRDQTTGETIGDPMVGHRGRIAWFVADPASRRVASVGNDGTMRAWDLETTSQVGREITRATQALGNWSGDGRWLTVPITSGEQTEAHLEVWNFDTDTWPDLACQLAGRNLTEGEWEQYGTRTIERRTTCPQYPLDTT